MARACVRVCVCVFLFVICLHLFGKLERMGKGDQNMTTPGISSFMSLMKDYITVYHVYIAVLLQFKSKMKK